MINDTFEIHIFLSGATIYEFSVLFIDWVQLPLTTINLTPHIYKPCDFAAFIISAPKKADGIIS